MPPRKDASLSASQAQQDASSDGIDAFELPKSLVTRLAKSALPSDAKLQKDTVVALVKGSTVFINYLAATAQDVASSRSHKTIAGADVLKALEIIEFGDLVPLLEEELEVYRGGKKGKVADVKGKGKEKEKESSTAPSTPLQQDPVLAGAAEGIDPDQPDDELDAPEHEQQNEEEGFDDDDMAEPEDIPEDEDDDNEEGEEVAGIVAIEEEELKRDQRGLEEKNTGDAVE